MEEIVQLTLGGHRHPDRGDLHLVLLQGDVVPVEVAAVEDILRLIIHYRIVTGGVKFLLKHPAGIRECLIDRP